MPKSDKKEKSLSFNFYFVLIIGIISFVIGILLIEGVFDGRNDPKLIGGIVLVIFGLIFLFKPLQLLLYFMFY